MTDYIRVASLVDALRSCVGRGATDVRLGSLAELRGLDGLASVDGLRPAEAGRLIQRHLKSVIAGMSGAYELYGRAYPADVIRRSLRLALAFDHSNWDAGSRRAEIIRLLGFGRSLRADQWARPQLYEAQLLELLALQLLEPAGDASPGAPTLTDSDAS